MRTRLLLTLGAVAFIALATPARADDWGDDIEVMGEEELGGLRGGLVVTPQLAVNFGAQITTFVDGAPVLMTNLTWTDSGRFVEQTVGEIGQRIDELSPEARQALGVEGLSGGVVVADADGVTALVHNITDTAVQNIIVNTAMGREIRQEVDVQLILPGFADVQANLLLERLGMRISDDMQSVAFGPR
jgi:hypothetical protein